MNFTRTTFSTVILAVAAASITATTSLAQPPESARVTGIGGLFFRASDPGALATWYLENLGIGKVPTSYEEEPWRQDAGPTVFSPFPHQSEAFGPTDKAFVLNFRTNDLDGLVKHLRSNKVDVTVDSEVYPNGRFASLTDPEGNPIQLWEPADPNSEQAQ